MRMSNLFGQTLREAPADAEITSHQLLVRAGFIRQLGAGIFDYLHLAKRSLTKIENIMREEMDAIGGQEITMPVIHPAEIWKESKRWYKIGPEMGRFKDKNDRDMVLAMTHEEAMTDLVRREIQSYRQLPRLVYHIQTKWRDDPRPRAGLIRVREFTMKDSYSLDADEAGLDKQYRAHYQAYFDIFHRCGLPVVSVSSDVGMMGGSLAHEFMYLSPIGEDSLVICDLCGYMANRQIATFKKPAPEPEELQSIERVATPGVTTIEGLANFLGVPQARTAKAVFLVATIKEGIEDREVFVFAIVRGDMEVNETKLSNALKATALRAAQEDEIKAVGAVQGYASPIGLKGVYIIVDDLIPHAPNLVAGANEPGYHLKNVNYKRDYQADQVADIVSANEGDSCADCGSPIRIVRGVEVGNIFKLGTEFSEPMGATFIDKDGAIKPVVMGSYGIGSGRLLASVAEEYNDEHGLMWPITVAPYQVHLVALREGETEADKVYASLVEAGAEVFYDDRGESPGVAFNDADLIGIPIRITVSKRSLAQGGAEVKLRSESERRIIALPDLVEQIKRQIADLEAEIAEKVVPRPFDEA